MTQREIFHSGLLPPELAYALGALVALGVVVMLAGEIRRRSARFRYATLVTRLAMVALLTLLLAQPNLLITRRTPQEGHSLVLVDDSASMFAKDEYSSDDSQLSLARALAFPQIGDRPTVWLALVSRLKQEHQQFDPLLEAAEEAAQSIRTGLPWSDRCQNVVGKGQGTLAALKTTLAAISKQPGLVPAAGRLAGELIEKLHGDGSHLAQLTSRALNENDWLALARQAKRFSEQLGRLEQLLAEQQAAADQAFLAAEGRQAAISERIQKLTRYEISQNIVQGAPALAAATRLNLVRGTQTVDAPRAIGKTQLVEPLVEALTARPLDLINAVYLFTDGGQNCNFDLAALDVFRKRGVKLVVVGVGGSQRDAPLTLVDYDCPPVIFRGTALPVRVEFRANFPKDVPVELSYALEGPTDSAKTPVDGPLPANRGGRGAALPHQTTVVTDGSGFLHHRVLLAADVSGPQTLRVEARLKDPHLVVTHRFGIYVRDAKPSVLLVAERPDKLTECILAQQQYGIRVYPVFTFGNAKNAKRGSSKQAIPKAAKDWGGHDLVILKGKPFPGFTPEDAAAIAGQMRAQGTAVLLVSDEGSDYLRAFAQPLGWPPADYGRLAAADRIAPAAEAAHLPPTILSSEVIRNQNIWQQFAAPGVWQAVPEQTLSLVRHLPSKQPVMSLGLYRGGKFVAFGLGGLARMNEWQSDHFEAFVRAVVLDLLTPTGEWKTEGTSIGIYPPVAVPGRPCIILARSRDNQAKSAEIRIEGTQGGSEPLPLAGQEGWLAARHAFREEGDYELHLDGGVLNVRCQRQESAETRDLSLRDDFLRQMAHAAGGSYVPLTQLEETIRETPGKTRENIDSRSVRTADFRTLLLIAFVALAGADFVIRKQSGMVL